MPTILFSVERELPCECIALTGTPMPDCPACDGCGTTLRELEVAVEYAYYRASRGQRDRWGVPLEPDEPEQVELLSVTDGNGRGVDLDGGEVERAEERCLEDVRDRYVDAMEARAEAQAEARRGW